MLLSDSAAGGQARRWAQVPWHTLLTGPRRALGFFSGPLLPRRAQRAALPWAVDEPRPDRMCSCRLGLYVLSACHFNLHKQLSGAAHMLLLLFPCSSVFSRSFCVAVSAWFQPRLGLHGGASPPLTSPLLPRTNPSETDILAPALCGVAQNAIGMVPGADHCTRDSGGGAGHRDHSPVTLQHGCSSAGAHNASPVPADAGLPVAMVPRAMIKKSGLHQQHSRGLPVRRAHAPPRLTAGLCRRQVLS